MLWQKDWARIAEAWRTGPDIRDSWISLYVSAFTLDKWGPFAGPGHWNDPDMMILGNVTTGAKLHPTRLTADEQYSHVSLFSLLAAPLLIGCPIEQLDAFTLNLLTNDEVIDIDQDPLGKSARLVSADNDVQVWLKPLEDGSFAVGMFNIDGYQKTPQSYFRWGDEKPRTFQLNLDKIGLAGKWKARDVWKQKNLGDVSGSFTTNIRYHGVSMIRLYPQKKITMMKKTGLFLLLFLTIEASINAQSGHIVWLDDLPIQTYSEAMRPVSAKSNYSHDTMRINGVKYNRGVGAQSPCVLAFFINKHAKRFHAEVAMDDMGNKDIPLSFLWWGIRGFYLR